MPKKDEEARRAYMREWYARPENKQRVIEKVAKRKRSAYAGVCKNCGGPTVGRSKNDIPEWCGKPECASAQRGGKLGGGARRSSQWADPPAEKSRYIKEE